MKQEISICWIRRDLRLEDNAALYHALNSKDPVLLFFIFDKDILDKLQNKAESRLTFIYETLAKIQEKLIKNKTSLLVKYDTPEKAWVEVLAAYNVKQVYINHDYEPYATTRDHALSEFLSTKEIKFHTYKDQAIFDKDEVVKADGKPYTVFTPYFKIWKQKLNEYFVKPYPTEKYFTNFSVTQRNGI